MSHLNIKHLNIDILDQLHQKALQLPSLPGVYLMKNKEAEIIYIGKAKLLPRRVSSYFQKKMLSARINLMVSHVDDFDFVVTTTEKESLILENRLIKKYRPKFNVILRDDKTYPSLRLTTEEYPRLEIIRHTGWDGSTIFGPFPSTGAMRDTIKTVLKLFPLRQCCRPEVKNIERPCLNFQIGRCIGPCRSEMTPSEYQKLTTEVRLFFRGQGDELLSQLNDKMKAAAERYEFEEAARLRNRMNNIKKTLEHQVVDQIDNRDVDVFGFHSKDGVLQGAVLMLRGGAVTGCLPLELRASDEGLEVETGNIFKDGLCLLTQYYGADNFVPDEIFWPENIAKDDQMILSDWLSSLKGRVVKIYHPKRDDEIKLLEMARSNAQVVLGDRLSHLSQNQEVMMELKVRLNLPETPRRLECFDLAHLQGQNAVAGLVVMNDCKWKKEYYRLFKIKLAKGGDDYGGMREVVTRRFSHADWSLPDLLLIDGGKGQLAAAVAALADIGRSQIPLAAIAKSKHKSDIDRIFLPGCKNPANLKAGSPGLLILARLRDEAHRFVRTYHHQLQSHTFLESPLLKVKGLGPIKRKKLLNYFGSLEALASAGDDEIKTVVSLQTEAITMLKKVLASWRRPEEGR